MRVRGGRGEGGGRDRACLPPSQVLTDPPPLTPSIGHNEVIGVCRVGPDAADPHGREHWAEMLANPRKPVEHWHQLVEVRGRHPTSLPPRLPLHSRNASRFCGLWSQRRFEPPLYHL